jgi:hypothetical protein
MSIWGCGSPSTYCKTSASAGFIYCRSQEWDFHSPSPSGFVYLEFSWTHVPFVCSSIQPYLLVAIAVFFYLEFAWGDAPAPLYGGACHTCAAVGSLSISKHTGGVAATPAATPALSGQLVYLHFTWECAPPPISSGASHMTATVTSFPLSKVAPWSRTCHSAFTGQLVYLHFVWGGPLPYSPV